MLPPVIHPLPRTHGVVDDDILAAYSSPIAAYYDLGDHDLTMHVGFDAAGNRLLEVGFATTGDPLAPVVIVHAMPARPKYIPRREMR